MSAMDFSTLDRQRFQAAHCAISLYHGKYGDHYTLGAIIDGLIDARAANKELPPLDRADVADLAYRILTDDRARQQEEIAAKNLR